MRAVLLPATPLLVPGLLPGLQPDPLAGLRDAVSGALAALTAGGRLPLVVAHGPVLRQGRMRPSLAGSGIGDRWLPGTTAWPPVARQGRDGGLLADGGPAADGARAAVPGADGGLPPTGTSVRTVDDLQAAGTGASVALLALAAVLGARAADVEVLEVPPTWTGSARTGPDHTAVRLLHAADGLVVAAGGVPGGVDTDPDASTDGVRAALRAAGAGSWTAEVHELEQSHDHLPPRYRVTTLS